MRNKIILCVLAISCSSCSIFQKIQKDKDELKLDSVGHKLIKEKSIDTGSIKNYTKIKLYYTPNNNPITGFGFAKNLIDATQNLVGAQKKLLDTTNSSLKSITNLGNGKKNNPAANFVPGAGELYLEYENWSTVQNGTSIDKSIDDKIDVNKKTSNENTKSEGSSKLVLILCVVAGFVIIILAIFIFLYYKSGNSIKDLFTKK